MSGSEDMNAKPLKGSPDRAKKCYEFGHRNSKGEPCGANAIKHLKGCRRHAGKTLAKAKAESAVRQEALNWGLDDEMIDPGLFLLRLVAQSSRRVVTYSAEVQRMVEESDGSLEKALTATRFAATEDGSAVPIGEYTREMVRLEAEERDRGANLAIKAVAAGLAERQVRMAEQMGGQVATMLRRAVERVGLSSEQAAGLYAAFGAELQAIVGSNVIDGSVAA